MLRVPGIAVGVVLVSFAGAATGCKAIQDEIYKSAIVKAMHEDSLTGTQPTYDHVSAMKRVDLSDCPQDFRLAYSHHIHAWEEATAVREAQVKWKNDEDGAAMAGLVAGLFDSDSTPWADHVAAGNRLKELAAQAAADMKSTANDVDDTARKYGVQVQ